MPAAAQRSDQQAVKQRRAAAPPRLRHSLIRCQSISAAVQALVTAGNWQDGLRCGDCGAA